MQHALTLMCRVYGVTRAGYYAWRSRERSERERQDKALAEQSRAVHIESRGIYGSPRVRGAGAFKDRIAKLRFTQSMNRPGKVTDNAFMESFFHSMKSETFHGHRFNDDSEVRSVLKSYLPFYRPGAQCFVNRGRRLAAEHGVRQRHNRRGILSHAQ